MAINIPLLLDRLPYRYPSLLLDAVVQHEPGRRLVAAKNVTRQRGVLPGAFPRHAAHAGRADDGGAGAGRGGVAVRTRERPAERAAPICAASTTRSSAARSCPGIACGSKSTLGQGAPAACARARHRVRRRPGGGRRRPAARAEGAFTNRPASDRASRRRDRRRHDRRARSRRLVLTSASARNAGSAPRPSSTAGRRSATRRRCSRSRRSD